MFTFGASFLKHLSTIWTQFFGSPYFFPAICSILLWDWPQDSGRLFVLIGGLLVVVYNFSAITALTSVIAALVDFFHGSMGAGMSPILAAYALQEHFKIKDYTWLTDPPYLALFYPDSYWTFFYFYVGFLARKRGIVSFLVTLVVVHTVLLGLAFGVQHFIYSSGFGGDAGEVQIVAVGSMAAAFSIWILMQYVVGLLSTAFQGLIYSTGNAIIEPILRIAITVLILAFALSGFFFLQAYQATLWLLFWIIAYPVALSFTRGEPLKAAGLVEIYVAGLKQVPIMGQIFASYIGKPSTTSPDAPSGDNARKPGSRSPKSDR
jgi:hypothetical protein